MMAARILLVDDDDAGRYAKSRILRQAGYRVVEVWTGQEALEAVVKEEPDLILLDVRLPDISGLEVCRRIRTNPATTAIPVLQISASFCDDKAKIAGLEGGADGYIAEPIEPTLLIATVDAFLRTRRAEQAVREHALELQTTFDAIGDGVALVDTSGKIVRSNRALAALLNCPSAALIDMNIGEILPAVHHAELWPELERGERYRTEVSWGERVFTLSIDPVSDNHGQLRGGVCIICDITERKLMNERLWHTQKLESIGVLAGGVAHDFNNLLMGILGNASLAMESLGRPQSVERALRDIVGASERAADLTRQLLAYSGKGRFVVQPVDVSGVVGGMAPLLKVSFPGRVHLVLNLSRDLPAVEADKTQLEQVIMNLLINAAEAIGDREGTVQVTTDTCHFAEDARQAYLSDTAVCGHYVRLEIRDDGIGMDEKTMRQIFDPFFTTKFLGRGLGLSAVLGIMRGHRGAIRIASNPGRGSTFELLFPASQAAVSVAQPKSNDELVPMMSGHGAILVADDEPIIADFFECALERQGYEVVVAHNGEEAVRIFSESPDRFSLVLLDLVMPVMSGRDALRCLLDIRPNARIVITSGQAEETVRRDLCEWSIAGFIQKPCAIGKFLEKIRAFSQ